MLRLLTNRVGRAISTGKQKVDLNGALLLGSGVRRHCFVHPNDSTKCIKVLIKKDTNHLRNNNAIDWVVYQSLLKCAVPLKHVAKCYGYVDTAQGPGLVFERVVNEDGSYSKTLSEEKAAGTSHGVIKEAIMVFFDWAIDNAVIVADINEDNFMLRYRANSVEMVCIDGLGAERINRSFLLNLTFIWLRRKKTREKFSMYWPDLYQEWLARRQFKRR